MPTVDTALSPREILNQVYYRLRNAYSRLLSAQPGDVEADKSIMAEIKAMEALMKKLDYSFIIKLRNDASIDEGSFEKLQEIERLLDEISIGQKQVVRQDHYLYHTAKRMGNYVRGVAKKSKRKGIIKLKDVQREKQKLAKEEKDAKERAGKAA